MPDEISFHELMVFRALRDNGGWVSNRDIFRHLSGAIADSTVRVTTRRLAAARIADVAAVYPGYRYRFRPDASGEYLARLLEAEQVFEGTGNPAEKERDGGLGRAPKDNVQAAARDPSSNGGTR